MPGPRLPNEASGLNNVEEAPEQEAADTLTRNSLMERYDKPAQATSS